MVGNAHPTNRTPRFSSACDLEMADNIGKIGGPAMMRLVVEDEVSDDTTVKLREVMLVE